MNLIPLYDKLIVMGASSKDGIIGRLMKTKNFTHEKIIIQAISSGKLRIASFLWIFHENFGFGCDKFTMILLIHSGFPNEKNWKT